MDNESQNVIITDIKMSFFSMVIFMVKWTLATIPALIIVSILVAILLVGFSFVAPMLGLEDLYRQFLSASH